MIPELSLWIIKTEEEEILHKKYEEYKKNYLPTSNESWSSSLTPFESSIILNLIYKPRLFSIFKQN